MRKNLPIDCLFIFLYLFEYKITKLQNYKICCMKRRQPDNRNNPREKADHQTRNIIDDITLITIIAILYAIINVLESLNRSYCTC